MWPRKAGVVLLALCASLVPYALSAHATPVTYTPATGATELRTPESISIRFTERIEIGASSLTVFGPNGEKVNEGKGTIADGEGRTLMVPVRDVGEGVYTVSWQVVSVDDGHFTKGANSFLIDATGKKFEGSAGETQIVYVTSLTEAVYDFFGLLGESILLSIIFFLVFILRPIYTNRTEETETQWLKISHLYKHLVIFGFLFILFGSTIKIIKKTTELAALQSSSFIDAIQIYSTSSVGLHLLGKIAAGAVFTLLFLVFRKKIFGSMRTTFVELLLIFFMLLMMYLQSNLSHAAASLFYPHLSIFVTLFHLLAKELVIGGGILILVLFCMHVGNPGFLRMRQMLPRYDALAALAILMAGVTGVYVTWLHLKRFENLLSTEWGTRFIALLIMTIVLGAFRLLHQFIIHPRIGKGSFFEKVYQVTLPVEVLVGLAVLFFSGYISITTPPFTVEEFNYLSVYESDDAKVLLEAHPYENGSLRVILTDGATGASVPAESVTVVATNREKGIGPNVLPVEKRFEGAYVFPHADLSPPGDWDVSVIAVREGGYDIHAQFKIRYPDDILATRHTDEVRTFDQFASTMIIVAAGIAIFFALLFVHSLWRIRVTGATTVTETAGSKPRLVLPSCMSGLLAVFVVLVSYCLYTVLVGTDFRSVCIRDGNEWRQAFPTRNFEAVAPNAVNGCFTHGGHYHFVDEREYHAYMESL